jgi:glycine cleavage system regulatory protein
VDIRRKIKIAAIKARLEFCEAERRQLLTAVTTTQVNLAKIHERLERVQSDLRLLSRDLEVQENLDAEEWN